MAWLAKVKMFGMHMQLLPPASQEHPAGPLRPGYPERGGVKPKRSERTIIDTLGEKEEEYGFDRRLPDERDRDGLGNGRIVNIWEIPNDVTTDILMDRLRRVTILPHVYDIHWEDVTDGAIIRGQPMTGKELFSIGVKLNGDREYGAIRLLATLTDKSEDTIKRQIDRAQVDATIASLVRYLERDLLGDE